MKPTSFMFGLALTLPISATATVAMESGQTRGSGSVIQTPPAAARVHRPLFIVKYVLRRPPPEAPQIVMDDAGAQIVPPGKDFPAAALGALQRDPNTLVCSSWGCQRKP